MLIDPNRYLWQRYEPEDVPLEEGPQAVAFDPVVRIYRVSSEGFGGTLAIYETEESEEPLYSGPLPYEPDTPIACDGLVFAAEREDGAEESEPVTLRFLAESGTVKVVLTPYLDTTEGMSFVSNGYNDDGTYTTAGLDGFRFNGIPVQTLYISSNHWLGFGMNTEQLQILRRDGCSTAIYRQLGQAGPDLDFLKIRFEGYTVYSNRIDANRLIYELFLFSNGDMFLNVVRTPTSGNTGTSALICNGTSTPLTLFDGLGNGAQVVFRSLDGDGRTWAVSYEPYVPAVTESFGYLVRLGDTFYTLAEGELREVPVERLTAIAFLEHGFTETPSPEVLTPLQNPHVYRWQTGGEPVLLKARMKAYLPPQTLSATADMSHISILGIKLMTAEFSGNVGVSHSVDGGASWSEETPMDNWLNTDRDALWESLGEDRVLMLRFILHDNATLSRFKITYIN